MIFYHKIGVGEHKLRVKNQGKYLFEDFHPLTYNQLSDSNPPQMIGHQHLLASLHNGEI